MSDEKKSFITLAIGLSPGERKEARNIGCAGFRLRSHCHSKSGMILTGGDAAESAGQKSYRETILVTLFYLVQVSLR